MTVVHDMDSARSGGSGGRPTLPPDRSWLGAICSGLLLIAGAIVFGGDDSRAGAALFGGALMITVGLVLRHIYRLTEARFVRVERRLDRLDGRGGLLSRMVGLMECSEGERGRGDDQGQVA